MTGDIMSEAGIELMTFWATDWCFDYSATANFQSMVFLTIRNQRLEEEMYLSP